MISACVSAPNVIAKAWYEGRSPYPKARLYPRNIVSRLLFLKFPSCSGCSSSLLPHVVRLHQSSWEQSLLRQRLELTHWTRSDPPSHQLSFDLWNYYLPHIESQPFITRSLHTTNSRPACQSEGCITAPDPYCDSSFTPVTPLRLAQL